MSGYPLKASRAPLPVLDLGLAPYLPVQALQARLRSAVAEGRLPGVLLLLEHEPVITLGSRAGMHDLRESGLLAGNAGKGAAANADKAAQASAIPVVTSERGGQATLHAPGQLVSYPIVPIPGRDLSGYVRGLEEANIQVLAQFGIHGERRPGRPGVYVAGDKVSSVGLRCQRWVSSHGTSLNVSVDLALFASIVSCGQPELHQTSMEQLIHAKVGMQLVKDKYLQAVKQVFGWDLLPVGCITFDRVEAQLGLEA